MTEEPFPGSSADFYERIQALNAEIERLKEAHRIVRGFLDAADAKLLSHEKLITGLCDALEKWCVPMRHGESKLIQRARDAAK